MVRQRDRRNFKFQNVVATPLLQITAAKSQIILLSLLKIWKNWPLFFAITSRPFFQPYFHSLLRSVKGSNFDYRSNRILPVPAIWRCSLFQVDYS